MVDLLSPMHLVVLGIVALLIFGPKRLPEIGSAFGRTLRGFRDAMTGQGARTLTASESERAGTDIPRPPSTDPTSSQFEHAAKIQEQDRER